MQEQTVHDDIEIKHVLPQDFDKVMPLVFQAIEKSYEELLGHWDPTRIEALKYAVQKSLVAMHMRAWIALGPKQEDGRRKVYGIILAEPREDHYLGEKSLILYLIYAFSSMHTHVYSRYIP